MRYFLIDNVSKDGDYSLFEFKGERDFKDSILYNRGVDQEFGEKVETLEKVYETLKQPSCEFTFNTFTYIKGVKLLKSYGYDTKDAQMIETSI